MRRVTVCYDAAPPSPAFSDVTWEAEVNLMAAVYTTAKSTHYRPRLPPCPEDPLLNLWWLAPSLHREREVVVLRRGEVLRPDLQVTPSSSCSGPEVTHG